MSELDLHTYTVKEALDKFITEYNQAINKKNYTNLKVIHGYGSSGEGGNIKKRFRALLKTNSDKLQCIFGEDISTNPGYTIVKPIALLPTYIDKLGEDILHFCITGKPKEKIMGKFRKHGASAVAASIKNLDESGKLEILMKGKYKCYISV